jgi:hypothetical protein
MTNRRTVHKPFGLAGAPGAVAGVLDEFGSLL